MCGSPWPALLKQIHTPTQATHHLSADPATVCMCCHGTPFLLQQAAAELITEDSGFSMSEAFAAAGPFDHVYSHPASAHAPSRLGAPQRASPALLCSHPTDSDMEVAAAAAAAAARDSDSQETEQDAAAGEEGDGVKPPRKACD
jgi:hypothetical protein